MNIGLIYTLLSVLAVSLISLLGLFTISLKSSSGKRVFGFLVSFSAGALLGDVFIHLLPELAEENTFDLQTSLYILGTIFVFFLLEKYLHWHHHHGDGETDEHATHPFVYNILIGDSIHNFIDGLIIAGAYMLDIRLGVATTIAVMLHEIPQEIGDFGVLVYGGFTKTKALIYNLISALSAIVGAAIAFGFGSITQTLPILVAVGAGSFIYISLADLIPQIHKEQEQPYTQLLAFALGITSMGLLLFLE
ncbi:MAG: ZIP family metal transporter [Candidatus Doudnabacteria bacterium]|nr:ZIP family metal transporter [Candidatus Doudnabacteria bacterium]